jgi:hypothetical protein
MYKSNFYGKFQCPCCGYYTLQEGRSNSFDICRVCFWEDDGVQFHDPDYEGGANGVSLNQARENFKKFGACDEWSRSSVTKPTKEEMTDSL